MYKRKAVVLVVVMGVLLVVAGLAVSALYLMSKQSIVTEDKIHRVRAYYATQAGMVHAMDEARNNATWVTAINTSTNLSVQTALGIGLNASGQPMSGYPVGGYNPLINVTPGAGVGGTTQIDIIVTY